MTLLCSNFGLYWLLIEFPAEKDHFPSRKAAYLGQKACDLKRGWGNGKAYQSLISLFLSSVIARFLYELPFFPTTTLVVSEGQFLDSGVFSMKRAPCKRKIGLEVDIQAALTWDWRPLGSATCLQAFLAAQLQHDAQSSGTVSFRRKHRAQGAILRSARELHFIRKLLAEPGLPARAAVVIVSIETESSLIGLITIPHRSRQSLNLCRDDNSAFVFFFFHV